MGVGASKETNERTNERTNTEGKGKGLSRALSFVNRRRRRRSVRFVSFRFVK